MRKVGKVLIGFDHTLITKVVVLKSKLNPVKPSRGEKFLANNK